MTRRIQITPVGRSSLGEPLNLVSLRPRSPSCSAAKPLACARGRRGSEPERPRTLWFLAILTAVSVSPAAAQQREPFPLPEMTSVSPDVEPFQYSAAVVPYYPAGKNWGTLGAPFERMQQPVPPEESLKHLVTPRDFEVQLFAAEPDITKPICLAWDERGRLWIAESVDYPNQKQASGNGRDRIKICEDRNGDGRADKFTVFADQLSIPTSLVHAFGGVIVHQAPHTLFLKDSDGDDIADVRKVLFTGWSTRDTHAGPSNLQFGPDNWLWGMQGYSGFDGELAGAQRTFNRGFYRFRLELGGDGLPFVAAFEFMRSTDNNSWGIGFSEDGLVFGSTANRNPSVYLAIPNRFYEMVRGWSTGPLVSIADDHLFAPVTDRVRQVDHHGGYTAAAGHALYTARRYPQEYWNRAAFVCGPTGHLVGTFVLERDGAGFSANNRFNLLASDDEWSAPIVAEVGPDGNVWVIDWYNFIVQHNPTPAGYKTGKGNAYESHLRDKHHGRVYRIVMRESAPIASVSLEGATAKQLVAALRADNLFWRRHAQRLLVERGKLDVVPPLVELVRDRTVDSIGLNTAALHALWTLDGLRVLEAGDVGALEAVRETLTHPSAAVRRGAIQVMPHNRDTSEALLVAGSQADRDAGVRLAALLAFAEMPPDPQLGAAIVSVLQDPENYRDPLILDAATAAAARHDRFFLAALAAGVELPSEVAERVSIIAHHLARGPQRERATEMLTELGNARRPILEAVITGLASGWQAELETPLEDATDASLVALLPKVSAEARGALARLAILWRSRRIETQLGPIVRMLEAVIQDESKQSEQRVAAAEQLIALQGDRDRTVIQLLDAISPRMPPRVAAETIACLSGSNAARLGSLLIERSGSLTPRARSAAIRVLLERPRLTTDLLDAIESGTLAPAVLSLDQKQALLSYPDPLIANRAASLLARGGDLPNSDRQQVVDSLVSLLNRRGDPVLGKEVFSKQCAKCHTHSGEGTRVGPDLTGMAVHTKLELLTHLIDPSRSVEGNYQVYTVVTVTGRVLTGLMLSETQTTIELFDSEARTVTVLREEIDELQVSPKSLMPDGFERQVTDDQLVDLLEFLTQRGKYLPIPLERAATVVTTRGMLSGNPASSDRLVFDDWSPKQVGEVPFQLVDPRGTQTANAVMLYGPQGVLPRLMPKQVQLPCHAPARRIHLLSGMSGWGYPTVREESVSLVVRLRYASGETEEHALRNGVHFADFSQLVDVAGSQRVFELNDKQVRYLAIEPSLPGKIETIELVKGTDETAPLVLAVTVELP